MDVVRIILWEQEVPVTGSRYSVAHTIAYCQLWVHTVNFGDGVVDKEGGRTVASCFYIDLPVYRSTSFLP